MELYHLVVLHSQVVAGSLQVRHLHKEPTHQRASDVQVVVLATEVGGSPLDIEPLHDPGELLAYVVCRHERAVVEEVVVAPLLRHGAVLLEGVVHVQEGEVVPVDVSESHLRIIRRLLLLARALEDLRGGEQRGDAEDFVGAVALRAVDQHLGQLRVQRELRHDGAELCEVALVVQRAQVVEQLQRAYQRLWGGHVHEVEVDQVVDAQLLQLQHHSAEVGAEDLGVGVVLHFRLVCLLRVQTEALTGTSSPGAACSLLGAGLGDGGHEQRLHSDAGVVHLLLGEAGVYHERNPVDGEGGLRDVRGHDALAADFPVSVRRRLLEYLLLKDGGKGGVERNNLKFAYVRS